MRKLQNRGVHAGWKAECHIFCSKPSSGIIETESGWIIKNLVNPQLFLLKILLTDKSSLAHRKSRNFSMIFTPFSSLRSSLVTVTLETSYTAKFWKFSEFLKSTKKSSTFEPLHNFFYWKTCGDFWKSPDILKISWISKSLYFWLIWDFFKISLWGDKRQFEVFPAGQAEFKVNWIYS